ncbi:MAG TPA: discoidin domain-containing protein, partial [Gemmatimonadales bacterium]|nr:discoidin domain-containing protein [Gemmatimonadales bacterium]
LSAMAAEYSERAEHLKARVQEELWDSTRQFFFHQFAHDEKGGIKAGTLTYETGPYAGDPHGRELIGYVPWQFNLPDSGYEAAWRVLMDTAGFAAPFGPTTVEQHDPQFMVSDVCCVWSGNQWPYATSQTLTAMANLLNDYHQSVVDKADYFRLLERYTLDQRKDGRPYIAEASNPFTGSWKGHDTYYHSEHYFHSTYVDLVITGLVGLRPRDDDSLEVNPLIPDDWDWFGLDNVRYRGRDVAILWDRDGSHYRHGAGLSLYVDGRRVAHADSLGRLVAAMGPAPTLPALDRPVNFAVNNGRGAFPSITASYSAPTTPPHYLIDGNIWYHQSPPNRWTDAGSGHASDTVTIDFGVTRPVEQVKLYFLDDSSGIVPPASYALRWWHEGSWETIPSAQRQPSEPAGRRANTVTFPRLSTAKLQLIVAHRPGMYTGLSEIEAWAHAQPPFAAPRQAPSNVAINPSGAGFPKLSASFTAPGSHVESANDGIIAYTRYSDNRWSARGTPNRSDWLQVDFGSTHRVSRAEIHFAGEGGGLAAPRRFLLQYWKGTSWQDVSETRRLPVTPEPAAANITWFAPVETSRMRVVMEHAAPSASAITELRIWKDEP